MFGSSTLDVAIGLAFVFLLLSLICTTFTEMIARWFSLRSRTLEEGIRGMLGENPTPPLGWSAVLSFWRRVRPATSPANQPPPASAIDIATDETPAGRLYNHPLVAGLTSRSWQDMVLDRMGRPSYMPSRTFAIALLDNFAPADPKARPKKLEDVRQKVAEKAESGTDVEKKAAKALLPLLDAATDDLKAARENVGKWFDDAMDRVSGVYKRRTQLIVLILALVVAGGLNADALMMANAFSTDASLRAAVVNAAQQAAQKAKPEEVAASVEKAQEQLDTLGIPVGWKTKHGEECVHTDAQGRTVKAAFGFRQVPCTPYESFMKAVGLLLTALALSLGAPFWFDLLNKLVTLRSSGDKPAKETAKGAIAGRP